TASVRHSQASPTDRRAGARHPRPGPPPPVSLTTPNPPVLLAARTPPLRPPAPPHPQSVLQPKPSLSPGRRERILFGSELWRRPEELRRGRRAAQEVGLHLPDHAAAELDVAAARALVALAGLAAAEARRDVFGDDSSGRFGEHTGLCDWGACDVAERVDTWEAGRKVAAVDGHPTVKRQPGRID